MDCKDTIKIERMHLLDGEGPTKAFCDLLLFDAFIIKGLRVIQGKNALFLSMPREKGRDGKWYDIFFSIDREIEKKIQEFVLQDYRDRSSRKD